MGVFRAVLVTAALLGLIITFFLIATNPLTDHDFILIAFGIGLSSVALFTVFAAIEIVISIEQASRSPSRLQLVEAKDVAISYARTKQFDLFKTFGLHCLGVQSTIDVAAIDANYQSFVNQVQFEAMEFAEFRYSSASEVHVPLIVWTEPRGNELPILGESQLVWVTVLKNHGGYTMLMR